MNELIPINYKNQRIMTTKVMAESFGTEEKNIQMNFSNNQGRFREGKHFIELKGQALKDFKNSLPNEIGEPLKFAPKLILWTDRGAARHAKILDTDEAWEVYEGLEENYFNPKNVQALNTSELSPELQMFNQMFKAIANNELEQKKLREEMQGIRDIVSLSPNAWRKDTTNLINQIARKLGGIEHIKDVREESYKQLNENFGVNIQQRLKNKQKNMALEGVSKTKINNTNCLDVIADDKKLINGYVAIIGKMAIKNGI